eukprot:TRINITY_DN6052_c0_g1_i1.p1 TRINITY_DN6052_c0_g1~~TRINITY_DN6052_c0_g1_i1.p1  ORF type:complete len:1248 (+),score=254.98 TRINITY_DN6052_c0_g1_i1:39-3746(+)
MGGQISVEQLQAAKTSGILSLAGLELVEVPVEIRKLHHDLKQLDLSNNLLSIFPRPIKRLTSLKKLSMNLNQLNVLPAECNRLVSLTDLSVTDNKLESIHGTVFKKCLQLESVDFSNNVLTALPEEIALYAAKLHNVALASNQFTKFPDVLCKLRQLRRITLSSNQLTALPAAIANVVELIELRVSDNQLASLPSNISALDKLQILDVSGNKLEALPALLGGCTALVTLDASQNEIAEFPESLVQCAALVTVKLGNNHIPSLPDHIGHLHMLRELELQSNDLKDLPESICELTNLTSLNVVSNMLDELPRALGQLVQLTSLEVAGNRLRSDLSMCNPEELLQKLRDPEHGLHSLKPKLSVVIKPKGSRVTRKTVHIGGGGLDLSSLPTVNVGEPLEPSVSAPVVPTLSFGTPPPHPSTPNVATPNLITLSPVKAMDPPAISPRPEGIKHPMVLLQDALEKLQGGEFAQGEQLGIQAAIKFATAGEPRKYIDQARQAAAVALACRLVARMRQLESTGTEKKSVCLFSLVVAWLPLPPAPAPQRITAVRAALRRNYQCQNYSATRRLAKLLLELQPDSEVHVRSTLSEIEGKNTDICLPTYVCLSCKQPTGCAAETCSTCNDPVRFCCKTLQLITNSALVCEYCNMTYDAAFVSSSQACAMCGSHQLKPPKLSSVRTAAKPDVPMLSLSPAVSIAPPASAAPADDMYECFKMSGGHLSRHDYQAARETALRAMRLMASSSDAMRHRSTARQAAAIYLAACLLAEMVKLDNEKAADMHLSTHLLPTRKLLLCLYSRVIADLALPAQLRSEAMYNAIKRNMESGNMHTSVRLLNTLVMQQVRMSDTLRGELQQRLQTAQLSEDKDISFPQYVCVACRKQVSCGDETCSNCTEPIRLCFRSFKLLDAIRFYSCGYCNAVFRPDAVNDSGCPLCAYPQLKQQDVIQPTTEVHVSVSSPDSVDDDTLSDTSLDSLSSAGTLSSGGVSPRYMTRRSRASLHSLNSGMSDSTEVPSVQAANTYYQRAMQYLGSSRFSHALRDMNKAISTFVRLPDPFSYQQEVKQCVRYKLAFHILMTLQKVGPVDPVRAAILTMQLADLPLEPAHWKKCVNMAIGRNMEVKNYGIAARYIQALRNAGGLTPAFAQQLEESLHQCTMHALTNAALPTYKCPRCEHVQTPASEHCEICQLQLRYCQGSFKLIQEPEYVHCPFCSARYLPSVRPADATTRCEYCNFRPLRIESVKM